MDSLLPDAAAFQLGNTVFEPDLVTIHLRFKQATAPCSQSQQTDTRVHSQYRRMAADVPLAGIPVQWQLAVRRFFCEPPDCPCVTFTEQMPSLLACGAQRSRRLEEAQTQIGFAFSGEAGCRLAVTLGVATSSDTLLRLVRCAPEPDLTTPASWVWMIEPDAKGTPTAQS